MEPLAPYNGTSEPMMKLARFFREQGLYTFVRWNTFFTNPPLTITEDELRHGFDIIDRGLEGDLQLGARTGNDGLRSASGQDAERLIADELRASLIAAATSFVVAVPPRSGVRGPSSAEHAFDGARRSRSCAAVAPR